MRGRESRREGWSGRVGWAIREWEGCKRFVTDEP